MIGYFRCADQNLAAAVSALGGFEVTGDQLVLSGPLYYVDYHGGVVFADHPGSLFDVGAVEPLPNDEAVIRFLVTGACDEGDVTFFREVRRIPAGYVQTWNDNVALAADKHEPDTVPTGRISVRFGHGLASAALVANNPEAEVYHPSFGPLNDSADRYVSQALAVLREDSSPHAVPADADTLSQDLAEFVAILGEPVPHPVAYLQFVTARAAGPAGMEVLIDPIEPTVSSGGRKPLNPTQLLKAGTAVTAGQITDRKSVWRRVTDRLAITFGLQIVTPYLDDPKLTPDIPAAARRAVSGRREAAPLTDWLLRLKNRIYQLFHTEAFTNRPWFDALAVREAFEGFIKGRNTDAELFWRIIMVELWAQKFLDPKPTEVDAAPIKGPLEANSGKNLEILVDEERWLRIPIRTELFSKGDDITEKISSYVIELVRHAVKEPSFAEQLRKNWYLLVSEKIVAIAQGRSYFVWEIEPSWWARTLSKYVVKTPYGIGLGSPWTMQLAIKEAGLPRILLASAIGAAGKLIGKRGLFYRVAGHSVAAIDGPTEYSVYPANVSAKLPPAEPDNVALQLRDAVHNALNDEGMLEIAAALSGCVVIDANDIGRNVLGLAADRPKEFFEQLFADNPLGQGSQQTPLACAFRAGS